MQNYNEEPGALIALSVTQDIPLSVEQFWSAFDDYLALQRIIGGHDDTVLLTGGGRPHNGVGAEVAFEYGGGITREVLWQKDDTNHVWVMGLPEPNVLFSYYRATIGVWQAAETARAKMTIDGVLIAEDRAERRRVLEVINGFLSQRIGEVCRFVLHRDGLRSTYEFELDYDVEKFWAIISDGNNVEWIMNATGVVQLGDQVRRIEFGPWVPVTEKLLLNDASTRTLAYAVLKSALPATMYEATIRLSSSRPCKTTVRYESVYLVRDGADAQAVKAQIDRDFGRRIAWMKQTFAEPTPDVSTTPTASVVGLVSAPIDEVWALYKRFGEMHEWWPAYAFMELLPPGADEIGAIRRFQTASDGTIYEETLVARDDEQHTLRYELVSAEPAIPGLASVVTIVSMRPVSSELTEVTWRSWTDAHPAALSALQQAQERAYHGGIEALNRHFHSNADAAGRLDPRAESLDKLARVVDTVKLRLLQVSANMFAPEPDPWRYADYAISPMPRMVEGLPKSQALGPHRIGLMLERMLEYGYSQFGTRTRLSQYPDDSLAKFGAFFGDYVPAPVYLLEHWHDDVELCRQLIQGINPMLITVVSQIEQVPAALRSLTAQGKSIAALIADRRLFIVDYRELLGLEHQPPMVFYAPILLVYKQLLDDGSSRLNIVGIQLERDGGPVYTPISSTPNRYLLAKMHVACADNQVHQFIWHLGLSHLAIEPMVVAAHNQLIRNDHPLGRFLAPHFAGTIGINFLARQTLVAPTYAITQSTFSIGTQQGLEIIARTWASYDFFGHSFPEQLRARGFDRGGADGLDGFRYRDDGFLIWDALGNYTRNMVGALYEDDDGVLADDVVQAWAQESASPDGAAIPGFPATITSRQLLADCLRVIIWTGSAMHSAINFPQFPYTALPLNRAASLRRLMPEGDADIDERVLLEALPDARSTIFQGLFSWLLSTLAGSTLLRLDAVEPEFPEVHAAFQAELAEVARIIAARNDALVAAGLPPYTYLLPSNIAASINI